MLACRHTSSPSLPSSRNPSFAEHVDKPINVNKNWTGITRTCTFRVACSVHLKVVGGGGNAGTNSSNTSRFIRMTKSLRCLPRNSVRMTKSLRCLPRNSVRFTTQRWSWIGSRTGKATIFFRPFKNWRSTSSKRGLCSSGGRSGWITLGAVRRKRKPAVSDVPPRADEENG